jgi:hypothetical protein
LGIAAPVALVVVAVALALAGGAAAQTIKVTNEAESGPGSLGNAILEAGPGDVIEIPAGTYPLTNGDTLVEQGNTLRGAGRDKTTIVPTGGGGALDDPAVRTLALTVADPLKPEGSDESEIETQAQIIALIVTVAIFLLVLELVRRRRLVERYALLWMFSAFALLVLAIWTDLLGVIADAMGIQEEANAIFILSFGVVFVLLLHFSVANSRLSEETKILAQEVARLDQDLRSERNGGPPGSSATERGAPSSAETADQ